MLAEKKQYYKPKNEIFFYSVFISKYVLRIKGMILRIKGMMHKKLGYCLLNIVKAKRSLKVLFRVM